VCGLAIPQINVMTETRSPGVDRGALTTAVELLDWLYLGSEVKIRVDALWPNQNTSGHIETPANQDEQPLSEMEMHKQRLERLQAQYSDWMKWFNRWSVNRIAICCNVQATKLVSFSPPWLLCAVC
jgi:LPS sulfotransferase NodH